MQELKSLVILVSIFTGIALFLYSVGAFQTQKLVKVKNVFKKGNYTFFDIEYTTQQSIFNRPKLVKIDCFVNGRVQATINDGKNRKLYSKFLHGDALIKAYASQHNQQAILDNY